IRGAGTTLTGTADVEGRYSFSGLKPGRYSVSASRGEFRKSTAESDRAVTVAARGCAGADVVLRKNWPGTIGGRVTRKDGTPGPSGMPFGLIRVEGAGSDQRSRLLPLRMAETDDNGEYLFRGVEPGSYKIVANLAGPPTPEDPYPTIYWPGASTEEIAS